MARELCSTVNKDLNETHGVFHSHICEPGEDDFCGYGEERRAIKGGLRKYVNMSMIRPRNSNTRMGLP